MSDWIEWHGGEQPVADDVVVEIRLRNGSFEEGYPAQFLRWHNAEAESKDSIFDIIAYRIVSQDSEIDRLRKENAALREALQAALTNAEALRTDPNGVLTYLMRIEKTARAALGGQDD